jgi:hypothetical protein
VAAPRVQLNYEAMLHPDQPFVCDAGSGFILSYVFFLDSSLQGITSSSSSSILPSSSAQSASSKIALLKATNYSFCGFVF